MIQPVTPDNRIIERLIVTIGGKFDEKPGFALSDISFALFYHHLYKLSEYNDHLTRRNQCLNSIMHNLEQQPNAADMLIRYPFFFNCLANLLQSMRNAGEDTQLLTQQLNKWNSRLTAENGFDAAFSKMGYLNGWAGIIHYFMSLPETCGHRQLLLDRHFDPMVSRVWEMCEQELFFLPDDPEQTDMGLAKGICGILSVLADVAPAIDNGHIAGILENCVHRLIRLRQEVDQSEDKCSFFPYKIDNSEKVAFYDNRLDWNSSDLGQALLLCRAALLCKNPNYLRMAEMVALNTLLRRNEIHTGIRNATLQHGAAGVAVLYKKLFAFIGHEDLLKGYHFWMDNTLALADKTIGAKEWDDKTTDLLEGPVGIGLTLLSHKLENTADWSKILLA